jgi:hypothetical protein
MWTMIFIVCNVIDLRKVDSKPICKRYTKKVDANEMFDIIKCGCCNMRGMTLSFDGEGRSPKNGVRIFDEVTVVIDDYCD